MLGVGVDKLCVFCKDIKGSPFFYFFYRPPALFRPRISSLRFPTFFLRAYCLSRSVRNNNPQIYPFAAGMSRRILLLAAGLKLSSMVAGQTIVVDGAEVGK